MGKLANIIVETLLSAASSIFTASWAARSIWSPAHSTKAKSSGCR